MQLAKHYLYHPYKITDLGLLDCSIALVITQTIKREYTSSTIKETSVI
jgi:hypothetical protein